MKVVYTRGALGAVLCAFVVVPAFAQHDDHQPVGAASVASSGSPSSCAQSSQGVTRSIDVLTDRIDAARQTNEPATMRAAVADLQVALVQIKTQLADCTSLTQAGGAMGNMAGMDHSKMQMAPGTPVMQPASPSPAPSAAGGAPAMAGMDHSKMAGMDHAKMPAARKPANASGTSAPAKGTTPAAPAAGMDHAKMAGSPSATTNPAEPSTMAGMGHSKTTADTAAAVVLTVRTDPAPPRSGKNEFEVTVKDRDGTPISDAEVSLTLYMPPMPSMKMAEMRNALKLTSAGNGVYRGAGSVGMAGDWDVTITVSRGQEQLASKKIKIAAR